MQNGKLESGRQSGSSQASVAIGVEAETKAEEAGVEVEAEVVEAGGLPDRRHCGRRCHGPRKSSGSRAPGFSIGAGESRLEGRGLAGSGVYNRKLSWRPGIS